MLVPSDSAGGSGKLAWYLRERGIGFTLGTRIDAHIREAIAAQPEHTWTLRWTLTANPGMAPRCAS